jgi:AraC-like DNA-binding protein
MPRARQVRRAGDAPIRVAALLGFDQLAGELGGDPRQLLRSAGIPSSAFRSPDNRISYAAMIELLEKAATELHCPDFGLRLSGYQDINILGPAAMIALYSDTVGDCLDAISTFFFVHTRGASVKLVRSEGGESAFCFEVVIPGLHAKRQINELSLGIGQRLLEMLIGPGFRAARVEFTHRVPDDLRPLQKRFGRNLEFDRPVNALSVPVQALGRPVPTANREFRQVAVDYVREHLGNAEENRVRRVFLLAHHLLPTGRCSLATVAEVLGIHPRRLQRELHAEGQDFRGILDQVRRELVVDYLADTRASLGQIADMLGYRDQAAFNNAFRRWFGTSPGHWRASRLPSRDAVRLITRKN